MSDLSNPLYAGVVSFNPDIVRLKENLDAVAPSVLEIVIVDNASINVDEVVRLAKSYKNVFVVKNEMNRGIAAALNRVVTEASTRGADWVLLLDQDSVFEIDAVDILFRAADAEIGMLVPTVVDRNLSAGESRSDELTEVDYAITSGSIVSIRAWQFVHGYDELMFIDFVDFDFCLRVREAGYRIRRIGGAHMLHEIGDARRHGRFIAYNHSATRSYHMARDMIYYARKHSRASSALKVQKRGVGMTYVVLARKAMIVLLFEEDKWRRTRAIFAGMVSASRRSPV